MCGIRDVDEASGLVETHASASWSAVAAAERLADREFS